MADGGMSLATPTPDPISDQTYYFPHPFLDMPSKAQFAWR